MDKQAKKRKRSTLGWVLSFAGSRKGSYVGSTLLAIMSVVSGFIPYIFMAKIMRGLLEKTADFPYCLTQCLWMALFFVLNRLFHAFSTTLSHRATFEVLANIRRRLTKKLSRMPLGDVLDESSGTYKNIIVERVDSIETRMAFINLLWKADRRPRPGKSRDHQAGGGAITGISFIVCYDCHRRGQETGPRLLAGMFNRLYAR